MQTVRAFITQPAIDIAHGHRLILRNIGTANPARAPYLTHEGLKVLLRLVRGQHTEDFVVPRPSVNVSGCPARDPLGARGAFFCPDRPAAGKRHNGATLSQSSAIGDYAPRRPPPWRAAHDGGWIRTPR